MAPLRFGDEEFERAYRMHADVLYRLALSYVKNKEDAEDVVQDAFVRYFCGFHLPVPGEQERAWLIRVAVNECKKQLRSPWRRVEPLEDYLTAVAFDNPAHSDLYRAVMELPKKYRMAIYLHYYEGYSVDEIAKIVNATSGTVKSQLHRARQMLRESMEEDETVGR